MSVHRYTNSMQLSDGRTFTVEFQVTRYPATYHTPPEEDESGFFYFIEREPCEWDNLPSEVTPAILEELINNASESGSDDIGSPDPSEAELDRLDDRSY
jgi:hypothetical protein